MKVIKDVVLDEFGAEHSAFRDLLLFMFKVDPGKRPGAVECLQHPFFKIFNS